MGQAKVLYTENSRTEASPGDKCPQKGPFLEGEAQDITGMYPTYFPSHPSHLFLPPLLSPHTKEHSTAPDSGLYLTVLGWISYN